MIHLKRVYEPFSKSDGVRILVERLWPRGVSKQKAHIDIWLRDLAPSPGLRKWYGHEPERWPEFQKRYRAELAKQTEVLKLLKFAADGNSVTFVYAASDEKRNSALVLKECLDKLD